MTDPAALLALARDTLKADVLPHLPPDRRYPALMVMTALGLAARRSDGAAEFAALAPFAPGALDLAAAGTALAAALRRDPGRADPELYEALIAATRAACAEANPKARALAGLPDESQPGAS